MLDLIMHWIDQHGYLVLFIIPMLELIFLPVSAEFVMGYGGFLVFQGKLNWMLSILMAAAGSSIGMTLAYWIGFKLGTPFFEKYGSRIHMGPERLQKTSQWFQRYGNKVIVINYFITGVRHITGYFAGITRIPFRAYMLYAYTGAFLWALIFVTLGKIFGPEWTHYHEAIKKYLSITTIIIVALFILSFLYKKYKTQIIEFITFTLKKGVMIFHSLRRVKILVAITFTAFLLLTIWMIDLIHDFLSNQLTEFDTVVTFLVHGIFGPRWSSFMSGVSFFSSYLFLIPVIALTFWLIMRRGKDRILEASFLILVVVGGEFWDEILRRLFHRVGILPLREIVMNTFPSEQTFITLSVLGFCAFLFVRHLTNSVIHVAAPLLVIVVSLFVGLSRIYFGAQFPSDVVAGYVFSGVWLSLNIVLLEIFRILRKEKTNV
ncbi:VTT domain-containing protein [Brevibacillus ginsengisoli]|uniref:VTT domain-containing protein n=1 Tax=Brevibacillus ginsengisoli TaxID=363854 RepID=UPI003CF76C8E